MTIEIQPYTAAREVAVKKFNQRLKQAGVTFQFPEHSESTWLPKGAHDSLYEEYFLACEDDAVRGGYILKHQLFSLNGAITPMGSLHLPLSEGVINPAYSKIGVMLVMNALKRQPLLFALGMGSMTNPLPQLLKAAGWRLLPLPFYFRVVNPSAFLKNIQYLRRNRIFSVALDTLAVTGLGTLGVHAVNALRTIPARFRATTAEPIREFGAWTDDIWESGKDQCRLVAVRDRSALNHLYPATKERFVRLKISHDRRPVGWCVLLNTCMRGNKYFGNMRVGSLADSFSLPGYEGAVVWAARQFLEQRGVDIIVSNQSHQRWCEALRHCGFRTATSTFIFAASVKLTAVAIPSDTLQRVNHFNRGDGEGPTHL